VLPTARSITAAADSLTPRTPPDERLTLAFARDHVPRVSNAPGSRLWADVSAEAVTQGASGLVAKIDVLARRFRDEVHLYIRFAVD
jgi:hypothetical protein